MLLGLFVGGAGTRMGGAAKGLLLSEGEPIVVRLARVAREAGLAPVYVGRSEAYQATLALPEIADRPAGVGPLGGLGGLLHAAAGERVVAVACDMPRLSAHLLGRLAAGRGAVFAPRGEGGYWEPLSASYDPARVMPALEAALARGERSFQALFSTLDVEEVCLTRAERSELVDWDSPSDIPR